MPPINLPPTAAGDGRWSDPVRIALHRHSSERADSTPGGSGGRGDFGGRREVGDTVERHQYCGPSAGGGAGSVGGRGGCGESDGTSIMGTDGAGGGGGGEGFLTSVDGVIGKGAGAGARRTRRSSSLGGQYDDHEDDIDSPRPPIKRYRNASTKARIACYPHVQVYDKLVCKI